MATVTVAPHSNGPHPIGKNVKSSATSSVSDAGPSWKMMDDSSSWICSCRMAGIVLAEWFGDFQQVLLPIHKK